MSNSVFPNLIGEEWDIKRSQIWGGTTVQESVAGKRYSVQNWSSPRYQWQLSFSYLDSAPSIGDLQTLMGFFDKLGGRYDTFLYTDKDDNSVTGQGIGTGDGATTNFQLVRSWGGYVAPVLAPNNVSKVYLGGVVQGSSTYTVNNWGSSAPGVVNFTVAPSSSVAVSADMTYYFPCRFDDDQLTYNNFMSLLYENKGVKFSSEK